MEKKTEKNGKRTKREDEHYAMGIYKEKEETEPKKPTPYSIAALPPGNRHIHLRPPPLAQLASNALRRLHTHKRRSFQFRYRPQRVQSVPDRSRLRL